MRTDRTTPSWCSLFALCLGSSIAWAQGGASSPPSAESSSTASGGTQSGAGALEEIVVTAQKRSENLQQVPIAVTALNADQLRAAGITSTLQLENVTPGLNLDISGGFFEPHLRGVGDTADGPGNESSIALYVDGIYYASQIWGVARLGDVADISVLKGPQGTLFGRNAAAGVIQINTRGPSQDFQGDISTSFDSFQTTTTNLFITGGVTETVATSFAAAYSYQGKGWGTDTYTDAQDVDQTKRDINLRNKWLYTPTSDTTVMLSLDYMDRETNQGFVDAPYPGTKLFVPGYVGSTNLWDADSGEVTDITTQGGGASVTLNQNLPFGRLMSISAYRQYSNLIGNFEPTATPILAQVLDIPTIGSQITQEIQLLSPQSSAVKWAVGLYYFNSHDGTGGSSFGASPFTITLRSPLAPPATVKQISIYSSQGTQSYAGFS